MDIVSLFFILVALLAFAALAVLPGATVAAVICCLKDWTKTRFWRTFATANMWLSWLPNMLVLFGPDLRILVPFALVSSVVWFFLNLKFLQILSLNVVVAPPQSLSSPLD